MSPNGTSEGRDEMAKKIMRALLVAVLILVAVWYVTSCGTNGHGDVDRGGMAGVEAGLGGARDSVGAAQSEIDDAREHADNAGGALDDAAEAADDLAVGIGESQSLINELRDIARQGTEAAQHGAAIIADVDERAGRGEE